MLLCDYRMSKWETVDMIISTNPKLWKKCSCFKQYIFFFFFFSFVKLFHSLSTFCRFQQSVQLQLTGGRRQPGLWSQPLSVPQPSGLWQGRRQHELPVQIDCHSLWIIGIKHPASVSQAKERDGRLACVHCLFRVCFVCAFGFLCGTRGHEKRLVNVRADFWLN